jgi:hypothetical protein
MINMALKWHHKNIYFKITILKEFWGLFNMVFSLFDCECTLFTMRNSKPLKAWSIHIGLSIMSFDVFFSLLVHTCFEFMCKAFNFFTPKKFSFKFHFNFSPFVLCLLGLFYYPSYFAWTQGYLSPLCRILQIYLITQYIFCPNSL